MKIIGCDLHARQQTLAVLDTETGEIVNLTLAHEGDQVRARSGNAFIVRSCLYNFIDTSGLSLRQTRFVGVRPQASALK